MIRIYCQQTIGGFKIFNISAFKHTDSDLAYVLVTEITDAQKAKVQDILVTNSQHNGLNSSIIFQFSSGATSMMIFGDCGVKKNETTLFVSPIDSKLKFAFVTNDKEGLRLFSAMASMWITKSGRVELSGWLSGLVSKPIIDNEMTFAFNIAKWDELKRMLSRIEIQPKFLPITEGKKGFLVYNTPHKVKILKNSGIDKPLSYFISVPGNDELRKTERNRKIAYISIGIGCCIAIASLVFWALKNHSQSSSEEIEIPEVEGSLSDSDVNEKTNNQTSKDMEIIAPYKEINDYVAERFNQPISLAFENEKEVKVSYTRRGLFKDMSVNMRIGIEEVKADSVLFSYDTAFGLDSIISKAISFIARKFPGLSAGIHPEDDHRIRINLSEIEKARPIVKNIKLRSIIPHEDGLRIEFGLMVPKQ